LPDAKMALTVRGPLGQGDLREVTPMRPRPSDPLPRQRRVLLTDDEFAGFSAAALASVEGPRLVLGGVEFEAGPGPPL
jgi:hypothetical protein